MSKIKSQSVLILICKDCKVTEIKIPETSRGMYKKYCDICLEERKKQSANKKNRYQRAKRIYPTMLRNLIKNYIYFSQGLRK